MYRYNGVTIILFILVLIIIMAIGIAVVVRKDKIETRILEGNGIINVQDAIKKTIVVSSMK